jgi:hypothetical protein
VKLPPWSELVKPDRSLLGPLAASSLLATLGLLLVWQLTDPRQATIDRFGTSVAQTLAALSVEPLLKLDRMHLGVLSNRVATVPEVSGVAVFTLDDQVLALSGELTSPRYTETVVFDDSAVGYVRVALNQSAFQDGLLGGPRLAGLLLVIVLAPLLVATGVALQRAWPGWQRQREAAAAVDARQHPALPEVAAMKEDSAIEIRHYLLAVNLHNQLSLSPGEREFELSLCIEMAEALAAVYQGQVVALPGVGVLVDFDHTQDPDRPFQVVCAGLVLARVLREESPFGTYRLGLHVITRPGDELLSMDDPAVADAALLSALARELTLAVSGPCFSLLERTERLESQASRHPLLDQLNTCDPECHLITNLESDYQPLLLQQTAQLTGQRRSTASESTF